MLKSLPPEPVNVALSGRRVFVDVKIKSYWIREVPSLTGVLIRREKFGHRHTERMPRHDGCRDWSGTSNVSGNCEKLEKTRKDHP